jgi:hypothetical protein
MMVYKPLTFDSEAQTHTSSGQNTRTPAPIPFWEDFDGLLNLPTGWTSSGFGRPADYTVYYRQSSGIGGSNSLAMNVYGPERWVQTNQIGPIQAVSQLKFWYKVSIWDYVGTGLPTTFGPHSLEILVNGSLVRMINDENGHIVQADGNFTQVTVDLSAFAGQMVNIMFRCPNVTPSHDIDVKLDNIEVTATIFDFDLHAISITGTQTPSVGFPSNYIITVNNVGIENFVPNAYMVRLMRVGVSEPLGTLPGLAISSGQTRTYTIAWTPSTIGSFQIYGEVVYASDQNPHSSTTRSISGDIFPEGAIVVRLGDWTSETSNEYSPINYFFNSAITQTLYLAEEIQQYGEITHLTFKFNGAGNIPNNIPVQFWLGTTNETSIENSWIHPNHFQLVFNGPLPVGNAGIYDVIVELDTPYMYATGNLVIMAFRPHTQNWFRDNKWFNSSPTHGRARAAFHDNPIYDPMTTPTVSLLNVTYTPNVRLSFAVGNMGGISGRVSSGGVGVSNVVVTIDELNRYVSTDTQGDFSLAHVVAGTYNLTAEKLGYTVGRATGVVVTDGSIATANFAIEPIPTVTVSGTVVDAMTLRPIPAINVRLVGYDSFLVSTNQVGQFEITGVYVNNTYALTVFDSRYISYTNNTLAVGTENLTLAPIALKLSGVSLVENFDVPLFPPAGWFLVNAGNGRGWRHNTLVTDIPRQIGNHNSPGAAMSESFINIVGDMTPVDHYLITPMISIPHFAKSAKLTWYVRTVESSWAAEQYSVEFSSSEFSGGSNVSGFTTLFHEVLTSSESEWTYRMVDMADFIGQSFQLAFRHHQTVEMFKMMIDDIEVAFEYDFVSDLDFIVTQKTFLGANYPNPFNPTTTIAFDLAAAGNVSLEVFNIRGQKVTTLVNDEFTAGLHMVNWDGVDSYGRSVSSGIYFYKMTTDDFTATRKMILMK